MEDAESATRERGARDRPATEEAIVAAAKRVLANSGFSALNVASLAAEAGVDRKLVYRYFGGIEGVVDRLGAAEPLWLDVTPLADRLQAASYGEAVGAALQDYARVLRDNALLRRLLAWELAEPSPLLARLDAARSEATRKWLAARLGGVTAPANVDVGAVNAMLIAALQHLALRRDTLGRFAGLELEAEGWARIEAAAAHIAASVYPA